MPAGSMASDGASGGILMQDLAALYRGGSALAPLTVRYSDFASWQREQLDDTRIAELLDYWRSRLAGAPVQLELPTDRPRPAVPSFEGGRRTAELPREIADGVRAIARAQGVTPFIVLLAAFQADLAAARAGQRDAADPSL